MSKLLAPNGKPSNLTPEQYALVRTLEFKAWFGFWDIYYNNLALDYYQAGVRETAHKLKTLDADAIEKASEFLSSQVTSDDVLISMPSRSGCPTDTKVLAELIASKTNAKIFNCLVGKERESVYDLKKQGQNILKFDFDFSIVGTIPKGKRYFIVDNVIGTGTTMKKAIQVVTNNVGQNVFPLVYAIDPNNVSKVVDENGEPLVVYHGSNSAFNSFKGKKIGGTDKGWYGYGYYFSPSTEMSDLYGKSKPYFLKIRKIYNTNKHNPLYLGGKEVTENYIKQGYEGSSKTFDVNKLFHEYCVFFKFPNNIKLADGTNTTFDENNPDIRYEEGGNTQQGLEVKLVQDKDLSDELLNIAYVELGYVGQPRLALLENGKIIGGIFLEKPSSYIENGEYIVQPMWEYKFDIIIVKSKRNKGYSKILLDAMIEDFVSNFPDADQIRAEVTNKKLEKSLQKNYGFSCDSGNDEKITYCYLSKEDAEKYKNTANIKFENGGTTKKNMKKVDKGGITYGRSHAEGGIPVKNESTGEMLEVEGGEGIINKKAMASPQMVKIDGKEMTICEAASYLNQKDGNGRQFNCDDVEHQQFLTDHYGVGGELKKGIATEKEHSKTLNKLYNQDINPNQAIREVAKEHIKENPNYYSDLNKMEGKMAKGGMFDGQRLNKTQETLYNTIKNSASKSMYTYNLSFEVERALNDLYLMGLVNREYIKGTQDAKYTLKQEYATGGTVMNNQDAENAIFDATVFEHGGTVNAYDAGLHKKMYMLGIEVMQPDPIALARVMSDENDNFCEHYPKLCAGAEYQREELPQIYDKNYDEFVAYLENLGATVNFEGDTAVDSLKPVQNEISLERMARIMARVKDGYYKDLNLLKLPLFVSQDGYILDGHHRWATLFFLSPTNTLDIYRVNLTYKELVDNALNFDDAGTEKFLIGGMVKKQEQLDKAFKNPSINDKKRISYYDIEYDADFTDLFRMEGSSQAMLKTKIASGVTANYRNLGSLVTKLFNTYVVPTAKDKYVTETTSRGFTYNWLIKLEDIESKDKRSYAYDWFLDKRDSSYGVLEFFQSGNLNYNKDSAKIFTMALSVFVERVIYAVKQNSTFSSFDDFVAYLDLPIKVLAENIKNILIQISEIDTNQPVTRYEWVTETNYRNQNQTAPTNANTPSTVNMQGTYSYFDVAYENASGEIKFDFTDPPKDCRVEIACNIDSQIEVLDDMAYNRQTSKREELFTDFLVEELNDTNNLLSRKNQGYNLKFEGKESLPYTIVQVDSMRSSTGIIETIESNLPISNYLIYKISSAVANFATTLLQMLDSTNWRGSGIPQFKQDSRYVDAKNELEKALYVVYIMALNVNDEQQKGKQLKDIDFSFWLDNFKKSSKTTRSANTNTGWNWRFKTEQEFIDEYGTDWTTVNEDVEWNRERQEYDMDFLFGQPIAENPTSENAIDSLIEDNDNYRVVNVDEYFGIKNPNANGRVEYAIAKEFITDKPLPTAAASAPTAAPTQQMSSFPSTNSITWSGEFNVGDNVKIRYDYSTDRGDGASNVPYGSPQNAFKITGKSILAAMVRPENPRGILYNLSNGQKWEGKDLESVLPVKPYVPTPTTSTTPLPTAAPPTTQTQQGQPRTREVYYNELLYNGVLKKSEKIVGARFLTVEEIDKFKKEYQTDPYSFGIINIAQDYIGGTKKDVAEYVESQNTWYIDLFGKKLDNNLLPMVQELFKFQKSLDPVESRKLFRTIYTQEKEPIRYSRLNIGTSNFRYNNSEVRLLFPKISDSEYDNVGSFRKIEPMPFPDWYKSMIQQLYKSREGTPFSSAFYDMNIGQDIFDPYYFFTGERLPKYNNTSSSYLELPTSYLMLEIEDTDVTPTATKKPIKKKETIYYKELLEKGMPSPKSKIVGARFLTENEISGYNKKYGTSLAGLELSLDCEIVMDKKALQDYEFRIKDDIKDEDDALKWSGNAVLGKNLNPNLLPMAIALYEFDKDYYTKNKKSLYLTTGLEKTEQKDFLQKSRLLFGMSAPFEENDFWKPLFPTSNKTEFRDFTAYQDIIDYKFPDWYKSFLKEILRTTKEYYLSANVNRSDLADDAERTLSITGSVFNVPSVLTGTSNTATVNEEQGYLFLPMSYLMFEIETEEFSSTNSTAVKKLKEEYAALQYYLNVEVPIDAFAQRKLISSAMETVSDNLEKEIEALYYSPSFEPLFEFWAEKQTQGQRMIDLQPCMLPTPNGEKSELDLVQYEIVRSEEFKKWFGDWEEAAKTGNYNGVSKAINPLTKEPQVVFHGKANMVLEFSKMAFALFPVKYFGTNLSYAEWFRENQSKSDRLTKLVYEFFLDIKNPIDLSPIGLTELTAEDLKEVIKAQYNYEIQSPIASEGTGVKLRLWQLIRGSEQMLEELKANTYFDGLIMYEDNSKDLTASGYNTSLLGFSPNSYEVVQQVAGTPEGNFTLDFVTFTNFQIKAADGRNTTFFNNVEDFRFAKGGITKKRKK